MKRIILFISILLSFIPCLAQVTLVQAPALASAASVTTITQTFASSQTAGNFNLVYAFMNAFGGSPTISDTNSNTYTSLGCNGDNRIICVFYAKNINAGSSNVVTSTLGGTHDAALYISEWSGVLTVSPAETSGFNSVYSGTTALAVLFHSVTSTQTGDVLFGQVYQLSGTSHTWTASGGATMLYQTYASAIDLNFAVENQIVGAAGVYTPAMNINQDDNVVSTSVIMKAAPIRVSDPNKTCDGLACLITAH